jgi:hypothetical protein
MDTKIKDSISSMVEYTIQMDEREWEDFAENPIDGHIVLHGLYLGINVLGWDDSEAENAFDQIASDDEHKQEMMDAWKNFNNRQLEVN